MQLLTKKTIKRILKKTAHVVDVEDFNLIEDLDRLAEKMVGVSPGERRLLSSPFDSHGIKFYPLTVAKSLWYIEKLAEWDIPELYHDGFFFWLLTLPLTSEALDDHSEFKKTNKAMNKLSRRLHCTIEEMREICGKCCGSFDTSDGGGGEGKTREIESNFGGLVAALMREYGQSPDYWLYEATIEKMSEFYDQFVARIVAEGETARSTSAKGGKAVAPAATAKLGAFKAFRDKASEIEQKWSAQNGD